MNPSVMNLQHRMVLELSVGLSFDQRQAQWRIDLYPLGASAPYEDSTIQDLSVRPSVDNSDLQNFSFQISTVHRVCPKVAKRSSQTLRVLCRLCEAKEDVAKLSSRTLRGVR